jgi:hypothetical protein
MLLEELGSVPSRHLPVLRIEDVDGGAVDLSDSDVEELRQYLNRRSGPMRQPAPGAFVAALARHGATVTRRATSAVFGCTNCGCIFWPEVDQTTDGEETLVDRYLIPGGECDAGDPTRPPPVDCACHFVPRSLRIR